MIYREVGKAKDRISRLGFGIMRMPEKNGKIDRALAVPMIEKAIAGGVNYFDTAYDYHHGDSQVFVGEVLSRYPRESYYLANKLPTWLLETEEDVPRIFLEQLQTCGVDYFDYYLMHAVDDLRWPLVVRTKAFEQMLEQKKAGRIRNLGFSFHGSYENFVEIMDACDWDFAQIQINYVDDSFVESRKLYDKILEKGIPCFIMEPLRGGFLAGIPQTGRRELERVSDASNASWALRWCMDLENAPVILSGMSTMAQLEENLAVFEEHIPLTQGEYDAIGRAVEEILKIKTIPCTGCGYCMDCSFGVDIPRVFSIYNTYMLFQNEFRACQDYTEMGPEHRGDVCADCGACVPMCPQGIAIPRRLADAHETLKDLKR